MGRRVGGLFMHRYGMPYKNAGGHIFPRDIDLVEQMLDVAERCADVHVVTYFKDGRVANRYETENVSAYYLFTGNADPDIEFTTEFTMDDFTAEEIAASAKRDEEFRNRKFTPVEVAAINFAMNALLSREEK